MNNFQITIQNPWINNSFYTQQESLNTNGEAQNYGVYNPFYQQPVYNFNIPAFNYPQSYYLQNTQNATPVVPTGIQTTSPTGAFKLTDVVKTPFGEDVYVYELKNGQTVALMPRKDATTEIKTFINAGSMNENDKNRGISHFNEHNLFNGSKNLAPGQFFKEVDKIGAYTNASTNFAMTDFYIITPVIDEKNLKRIIEMHADMIVNPTFPENMIEKERGPVTSEISMYSDMTTNKAMNALLKNLFQINSNSDDLVAGSIETVNNITRDDVYNHWKNHFTPDNMYTVLAGDFDPNNAIDIISKNFTTEKVENADSLRTKQELKPIQQSVRQDFISKTDSSTTVLCGFARSKDTNDILKDTVALSALNYLLLGTEGSRLSKELSPAYSMGDYGIETIGLKKDDPDALIYQFATQKGFDSKVIDKFYDVVKGIETNPPTADEMEIIKNNMLKSLAAGNESIEDMTDTIGGLLVDGRLKSLTQQKQAIENLTPEDIVNAANKHLDFRKMSVAVVHPYDMTEKEIVDNYNKSQYSIQKMNNNGAVSFTGLREVSTGKTEQVTLSDNSLLTLNPSTSDLSYIDWRLTCKDVIPNNPACAYVLTQILNDGSMFKSKTDFTNERNKNSVYFDTDANCFQIRTMVNCLYNHTEDAIKTMKEAIYAPRFTEEDFKAAVEKVGIYCSSMEKSASTNLLAKLYGRYFPSPKQILDGLETLTLDDVKAHYNNLIFNSSSNYVVTAPFEKHPEIKNTVLQNLNTPNVSFKPYSPQLMKSYIPNDKEVVLVDTEERNQAQIYKNYSFEISGNIKDEIKFELLNTILGGTSSSRLFSDLRETQKLAYTVSSQIQSFENSGILTLRILSTTDDKGQNDIKYDNLQKCIDGFKKHTDLLQNEYVTDEELEAAKLQLKQNIAMEMELPLDATCLLSMNMTQPYGIKRIDEYVKAIDSITKQDIKDAAKHIFSNKPVYSILASNDTVNNQADYINSLGEVVRL